MRCAPKAEQIQQLLLFPEACEIKWMCPYRYLTWRVSSRTAQTVRDLTAPDGHTDLMRDRPQVVGSFGRLRDLRMTTAALIPRGLLRDLVTDLVSPNEFLTQRLERSRFNRLPRLPH